MHNIKYVVTFWTSVTVKENTLHIMKMKVFFFLNNEQHRNKVFSDIKGTQHGHRALKNSKATTEISQQRHNETPAS
jgi:hypothetical protein